MIDEWRGDWGQDALPFGIVQLAYRSGWNVARNAQLEVAVGNLHNHADVFTEGGTRVVAALKASEFEITLDGGGNPPPPPPSVEPTTMHVSSLTAFAEGAGRGSKRGVAEVIVRDDQNGRVPGVTVTVRFSGSFDESVSGATDAEGYVRLVTSGNQKGAVVVNACVSGIEGALEYVPNSTGCGP